MRRLKLVRQHIWDSALGVLVGNKEDLQNDRKVETAEGRRFAEQHGLSFIETSAKDNQRVAEVLHSILTSNFLYISVQYTGTRNMFVADVRAICAQNRREPPRRGGTGIAAAAQATEGCRRRQSSRRRCDGRNEKRKREHKPVQMHYPVRPELEDWFKTFAVVNWSICS